MISIMSKEATTKVLAIVGAVLVLVATLWYIDKLKSSIVKKDFEISRLNFTVNEVVRIAEETNEKLQISQADHKMQLGILEKSLLKYSVLTPQLESIKGMINYAENKDDGISSIISDTLRLLSESPSSDEE